MKNITLTVPDGLYEHMKSKTEINWSAFCRERIKEYLRMKNDEIQTKVLILCGGLGTRIRSMFPDTPKAMIPINDKPFLEYQINILKKRGIKNIVLCTGFMEDTIKEYFGSGEKFGVNIEYSTEKEPLGTGGAVKNAEGLINDRFIVLNGDTLIDLNISELLHFHEEKKADATIVLAQVSNPEGLGLTTINENSKIIKFQEKLPIKEIEHMDLYTINGGMYIFERKVLDELPKGKSSLEMGLFPGMSNEGRMYGYKYTGYYLDVGTPERYLRAINDFSKGDMLR